MSAVEFIHRLQFADMPAVVVHQAKRAILDLVGVAAAGSGTKLSRIVRDFAADNLCSASDGPRMLFDGRRVSATGAAYAGASTIDSFDAHDGHRLTKGHAGVALFPSLLALADRGDALSGREMLAALVIGYEISTRAGIALHASASDYHTSGAWNALGVAAIAARLLKLSPQATRHALGIAEYHGPRSQMMRCIDHPTMLKDGSGWGALAGLSAAELAKAGFTGAPAVLMEAEDQRDLWQDLGAHWRIEEQYFKPHPVCRWAQPAVEAVARLVGRHAIAVNAIASIEISTFGAAARLGTTRPTTTEQAQYALGFPIAAFLARGTLGAADIGGEALADPAILAILDHITLREDNVLSARFPAARIATAAITLRDGTVHRSGQVSARGDPENPLSDTELIAKFDNLASGLPRQRAASIKGLVSALDAVGGGTVPLLDAVLSPI